MNLLAMLVLQAPAARSPMIGPAITLVSFALIMYFLIIRPQKKIQSEHRAMVEGVKRGDEIMTEGGLIGTVVHIAEDRLTIKSADARVVVSKLKVARVFTAGAGTTSTEAKA
jgi:preprotein translocase subunit YajC